jgi:paraquat-inducible protein A
MSPFRRTAGDERLAGFPPRVRPVTDASPSVPLVACHDCDELYELRRLVPGQSSSCSRCGAQLYREGHDVINRSLAYAMGSMVLFALANSFPFMEFKIMGRQQVAYLTTGITLLEADGYGSLALMVLFTSVLAPAVVIAGLLAILIPVRAGRCPAYLGPVCKLVSRIKVWSMTEVFMLGVLVALIKLSDMADMSVGAGFWAFIGLILVSTAALASFDPRVVWEALDSEGDTDP